MARRYVPLVEGRRRPCPLLRVPFVSDNVTVTAARLVLTCGLLPRRIRRLRGFVARPRRNASPSPVAVPLRASLRTETAGPSSARPRPAAGQPLSPSYSFKTAKTDVDSDYMLR